MAAFGPSGGGGGAPTGAAGGDLSGTYPNPTLANATWDAMTAGPSPADSGLLAWTFPFWVGGSPPGVALVAAQEAWAMRLHVARSITATNVVGDCGTAGASFTGNGAKFAIYNNAGDTQLFVTADVSGSLGTTGWKSVAFATPGALASGAYWIVFWANATTVPRFMGNATNMPRMSAAGNQYVFRVAAGITDMPATITPNTAGNQSAPWYLGIT